MDKDISNALSALDYYEKHPDEHMDGLEPAGSSMSPITSLFLIFLFFALIVILVAGAFILFPLGG